MKICNFLYEMNTVFLYLWYSSSIPFILSDKTISQNLMIGFLSISVLMIYMSAKVIGYGYKKLSRFDYLINVSMLAWFLFVTKRDLMTNYDYLTKIFYVGIDFASILFISYIFLSFFLEKINGLSFNEKNIFRLALVAICVFSYSFALRGLK